MNKKIRILFLAADPRNVGYRPRLDEEFREIGHKLLIGPLRDLFEVKAEFGVRPEDFSQALLIHRPHIVHFSGHGCPDGIVLQSRSGRRKTVRKEALTELFRLLKDDIRMVVLNACYSEPQAEEVSKLIDFTVGMKEVIGDQAAIVFASSLYRNLAFGLSVRKAYETAVNDVKLQRLSYSRGFTFLVREGVDSANTFLADDIQAAEQNRMPAGGHSLHPTDGNPVIVTGDSSVAVRGLVKDSIIVTGSGNQVSLGKTVQSRKKRARPQGVR